MEHRKRIAVAVVCLGLLLGTFVHYGATEDEHGPYPQEEALVSDYGEFVGERSLLFGTVQSADGERVVIEVDTDIGPLTMTVGGVDPETDLQPGGVVQVYGTLDAGRTITSTRTVVVSESGGAEYYKYAVSAVGAALVLAAAFRRWRIDTDAWELVPRG